MICKNCGATIQDTALFCNYCGFKQEKMMSADFDMDKTVSVFDDEPVGFVPPAPVITQPVIQPPMPNATVKPAFSENKDFDPDATVGVYSQVPPVIPHSAPVIESVEPMVPQYTPVAESVEPMVPQYTPVAEPVEPMVPQYTPDPQSQFVSAQPVADRMPPMDPRANKKEKKEKKEKKGFSLFKKTPKTVAPVVINVPMAPEPVVPVVAPVVPEPVVAPAVPEPVVAPVVPEPVIAPVVPEPVVAPVVPEPVVAPVVPEPVVEPAPEPTIKREVTDKDIYEMAQNHEPIDINTPDAQKLFSDVLMELVPLYSVEKKLETAMLMTAPADIKKNIANADNDTLFVAIKALNYHLSVGCDPAVLGLVIQRIYKVLKSRLS